jgi:hypothetical protein
MSDDKQSPVQVVKLERSLAGGVMAVLCMVASVVVALFVGWDWAIYLILVAIFFGVMG